MKAVHAFSLQQSAPSEPPRLGEDVKASDVDRAAYYSAVYYDDDKGLLWRLFWRIIWYNSVLLVACFAAFLIALSFRGPSQPALKASPPEEVIAQPSGAATPSEPAGLGVPEGTFDALFGTLADDHSLVAFFIPAREIVSPAASTVNKSPAAGPGPEVRLAAVATLEAEPTKALETASTVKSSAAAGPGPEARLAAVATLEAEPTKALEIASTVAQASAAALLEMPGVQAAAIAMPDAEPTKALEIVSTAVAPSGAGPGPEARLAAVATLEAEPTKALEIASTVAQASAAADQVPEVRLAAVATLEAEPTTTFETVSTTVEPSTGADPNSHAVDSREAAAVPAEPALSTPRMPRPRPADAVIVFARAATPSEPAGLGVPEGTFDALFGTLADDHSLVAFFIPAREIVSPAASTVNKSPAAGPGPGVRLAAVATLEAEPTKALEIVSTAVAAFRAPARDLRLG